MSNEERSKVDVDRVDDEGVDGKVDDDDFEAHQLVVGRVDDETVDVDRVDDGQVDIDRVTDA